jgi:hypothetical protein
MPPHENTADVLGPMHLRPMHDPFLAIPQMRVTFYKVMMVLGQQFQSNLCMLHCGVNQLKKRGVILFSKHNL